MIHHACSDANLIIEQGQCRIKHPANTRTACVNRPSNLPIYGPSDTSIKMKGDMVTLPLCYARYMASFVQKKNGKVVNKNALEINWGKSVNALSTCGHC